ncbi:MAG: YeiH family protein [Bdellovibrionia bacterium]
MFKRYLILIVAPLCLLPWVSSGMALFLGAALTLLFGNPWLAHTRKGTRYLLQASVIGLGAGMDLGIVSRAGLHGLGYTLFGIVISFAFGALLGRIFQTSRDTTILMSAGTAICGGSAIAAVAPAIRARDEDVTVSLSIVFILNSIGLYLFPIIGHLLHLSQTQFGLWSALAIHDTSSVVGATMQYGAEALKTGTTVKLARALWIVPVSFIIGYLANQRASTQSNSRSSPPWFILGFLIMAAIVTWIPALKPLGGSVESIARRTMVLTLFLIGTSMTRETFKRVGLKPLLHGTTLWAIIATMTLSAIAASWIQ